MKLQNDKEIIIGRMYLKGYSPYRKIPFYMADIRQLCFSPNSSHKLKYSVLINTPLSDENDEIYITKEQYENLQEKLGANDGNEDE